MTPWLTKVLVITLVAVAAGFVLGLRYPRAAHGKRVYAWCAGILVLMTLWYASARLAREYADLDCSLWTIAEWWAHSGKWYVFMAATMLGIGFAAGSQPPPHSRRTSITVIAALLIAMAGTGALTMPIYLAMKPGVRQDKNGVLRQSSPHTCGPVSLANYLVRCEGRTNVTERDIARLSGTTIEGTTFAGLLNAAKANDLRVVDYRHLTIDEIRTLNKPAIVSISTIPSVHHATLLWKFDRGNVHLIDPDYGYEIQTTQWFEKVWYGKTLILE